MVRNGGPEMDEAQGGAMREGEQGPEEAPDAGDGPAEQAPHPHEGQEGREPGLETRLRRLEAIVGSLEADDLELERALALFEEGVGHVREAERILSRTELRVEELLGDGSTGETRPFRGEEE